MTPSPPTSHDVNSSKQFPYLCIPRKWKSAWQWVIGQGNGKCQRKPKLAVNWEFLESLIWLQTSQLTGRNAGLFLVLFCFFFNKQWIHVSIHTALAQLITRIYGVLVRVPAPPSCCWGKICKISALDGKGHEDLSWSPRKTKKHLVTHLGLICFQDSLPSVDAGRWALFSPLTRTDSVWGLHMPVSQTWVPSKRRSHIFYLLLSPSLIWGSQTYLLKTFSIQS